MKQVAFVSSSAVALVLGLAGCGGDLTLPASPASSLSLSVLEGDGQTGTVGEPLPAPVVVMVHDESGAPTANQPVAFVGEGSGGDAFDPDTVLTNDQGVATTKWVLGTAPGDYSALARVVAEGDTSAPGVPLRAAAVAGSPDTVRAISTTTQPGHREEPVADSPAVVVVDRFGNAVPGAVVEWKAEEGNGELSAEQTATAADGTSSVTWTLGNRIGVQRATAEVNGASQASAVFSAAVPF